MVTTTDSSAHNEPEAAEMDRAPPSLDGSSDDEYAPCVSSASIAPEADQEPAAETRTRNIPSAVDRSVSLRWLLLFVAQHRGKRFTFERREFLASEDGGGSEAVVGVAASSLDAHRVKRRMAETSGCGKPVTVRYSDIGFELMTTADVMEAIVRPEARMHHRSFAEAKIESPATGPPTYFVSHAWDSLFVELVDSVTAFLEGAALHETCIWLDIFAISQDDTAGTFSVCSMSL
eukprot:SAG31_NODE_1675_length_7552_cov_69.287228_3_plen_233_part_00